jgi:uncharacterized protein DUF6766
MFFKKYGYAWLTLAFFLGSLLLHWYFGWKAFVDDSMEHGQTPQTAAYLAEMLRDTFENWQSEFLQLLWQVAGLAYFLYVGSPASKENDDRIEAKVDALLHFHGEEGRRLIQRLDEHFLRVNGHPQPHGHDELDAILAGEVPKGDA